MIIHILEIVAIPSAVFMKYHKNSTFVRVWILVDVVPFLHPLFFLGLDRGGGAWCRPRQRVPEPDQPGRGGHWKPPHCIPTQGTNVVVFQASFIHNAYNI